MLPLRRRSPFAPPPTSVERMLVLAGTTMAGSLVATLPVVLEVPLLPPLGFIVFIAWRLLRVDAWPLWAGLPLGLWDDLNSAQPIGTAMCAWTAALLAIDVLDRRLPVRDHVQDWSTAMLAIISYLLFALVMTNVTGGATSLVIVLPQMAVSVLVYPIVARLCAAIDPRVRQ